MLVDAGDGILLEAGTAAKWKRLVIRVYQRTGRTLRIVKPYGGNRTWAVQAYLHGLWRIGKGNYAAPPGQSNHEDGRAFDIANYAGIETIIREEAEALGLTRDPSERWHWNDLTPALAALDITPIQEEEDPMFSYAYLAGATGIYIVNEFGAAPLTAFEKACFDKLKAGSPMAMNEIATVSEKLRAMYRAAMAS